MIICITKQNLQASRFTVYELDNVLSNYECYFGQYIRKRRFCTDQGPKYGLHHYAKHPPSRQINGINGTNVKIISLMPVIVTKHTMVNTWSNME